MTKDRIFSLAVISTLIIISVISYIWFSQSDLILFYHDAASRLNLARRIIDSLTPGIGQIGTLWLPFPQVMMIPLIWHDPFWQSGFAGSIISMLSFVGTGWFLYKTIFLWGKDRTAGIIGLLIYITNINVIYLQTAPLSELLFLFALAGSVYYYSRWVITNNVGYLLVFASFISFSTLIRYEGYLALGMSFIAVVVALLLKENKFRNIEGKVVLFGTLALTGVLIWSIYQMAIFKDPIYWLKVYTQQASLISTEENRVDLQVEQRESRKLSILGAGVKLFNASAQLNGVLITYSSLLFLFYIVYSSIGDRKRYELLLGLLPLLGAFLFTVVAVMGGFPLDVPALNYNALFDINNNYFPEYNIRYGLVLVPFIVIVIGWAISNRTYLKFIPIVILAIQIYSLFPTGLYLQYSLPRYMDHALARAVRVNKTDSFNYIRDNYDGGLIMISTLKHDPTIFYWGLDYKTYIHEGTQNYWLESIENPQDHARWIYMYAPGKTGGRDEDSVAKELKDNPNLYKYYNLVYDDQLFNIFKIKDEYDSPELSVEAQLKLY